MEGTFMKSILIALSFCLSASAALADDVRLLMFEQDGCHWCEIWDQKISRIYPKTLEGRTAPLQRVEIRSGIPKGMTLTSAPQFTPTFVVVDNGTEIGRIEGYPGEDFFWGLLDEILKTVPEYKKAKSAS
jgi:thioredoxin-related protein